LSHASEKEELLKKLLEQKDREIQMLNNLLRKS
jgi:hypothetical protein